MFSDVLLTVDYDRTLTGPDSVVPERNLRAIGYFMENGGAFTVNTGRSVPTSVRNILGVIPHNVPLLLYNGSAAYDPEKGLVRCVPIDLDPQAVIDDLQSRFPEISVEIQGQDAHYLFRRDEGWERFNENLRCAWAYAHPHEIPGPFLKMALYNSFRIPTVAGMHETTAEEAALFDRVTAYIEAAYGEKLDVYRSCPRLIDLHAKGCSKLVAARSLQRDLGRKLLVCVGDGLNDLAMLQGADYAFCPADGVVADRFETVCGCAQGAVADVIYEKIPEILANRG